MRSLVNKKYKATPKLKPPDAEYLKWLVDRRKENQGACAHLYSLLTPKCWKRGKLGYEAKTLVSIGFSLWRAAFLADKSGTIKETNEHAIYFLGEMLETNAINFPQDKKARGFTFNYYLANVRFRLAEYKTDNPDFNIDPSLLVKGGVKKLTPAERWQAFQQAFEDAVKHFECRL
jgi:hypothetical protein